jgi:hypothetical protein
MEWSLGSKLTPPTRLLAVGAGIRGISSGTFGQIKQILSVHYVKYGLYVERREGAYTGCYTISKSLMQVKSVLK